MISSSARWLGASLIVLGCTARGGGSGGGFFVTDGAPGDAETPEDASAQADVTRQDGATQADAGATGDPDGGPRVCAPNEVTCASDTALRVCSADGASVNTVPCGAGTRCSAGQCVASLCAPSAFACGPMGRRVCNAEGTGYTDAPCPNAPNASSRCEGNGACVSVCADGYGDCDGAGANGCERSLREDPAHCGACNVRCEPGTMCMGGACRSSCGMLTQCGGACVDTRSSAAHCGGCDGACVERPNAPPVCRNGSCALECAGTFADCDFNAATGCEVDMQTSAQHCGGCGRACASGQSCVAGVCRAAGTPRSCREVLAMRPGTASGPQRVDPDGTGPAAAFDVYCDMTTAGGGWTLAATFTNADAQSWSPRASAWVSALTFGAATSLSNADAKTPAYTTLPADELLVVRGGTSSLVELQSSTSCLRGQTLQQVMSTSSLYSTTCARSCAAVSQAGIFASTASCHGPGVRLRCRDDYTATVVNGFTISTDDNSMITSLTNTSSCTAHQSGLGAMSTTTYADVDGQTSSVTSTDVAPRHLFVR